MKASDRLRALNAMAIHLEWLLDDRWCRLDRAIEILGDHQTRSTLAGTGDSTGRRSTGTHSDPTAAAVLDALEGPVATADRSRVDAMVEALDVLASITAWIRTTMSGQHTEPGDAWSTLRSAEWCMTIPHSIAAWAPADEATAADVDDALATVELIARRLQLAVEQVLRSVVRKAQPKRRRCEVCARHGITTDIAEGRYAHWCRRCGDFLGHHGFEPSEQICRTWDRGVSRITPGMVAEARAAAKGRRKRRARRGS